MESEGPGQGAAFTVDLPVATGSQPPRRLCAPQPSGARAGVRILVVDDNIDLAELLAEALQEEGFQTSVAHDGHAALGDLAEVSPHVGVLDVGLPDLDGYELARRCAPSTAGARR